MIQFESPDIGLFDIRGTIKQGVEEFGVGLGRQVVLIVPDKTRTFDFRILHALIWELKSRGAKVKVLIATGTHGPMDGEAITKYFHLDQQEGPHQVQVGDFINHNCDASLHLAGELSSAEMDEMSGGRITESVPVRVNPLVMQPGVLTIVLGPVFPHEVMGMSAGAKYLFPGIAGRQITDQTHLLGAYVSVTNTIGKIETPMRRVIEAALRFLPSPVYHVAFVVDPLGQTVGLYCGDIIEAQRAAAQMSLKVNVKYVSKRYRRVIALMPEKSPEMWLAGKGSYKLGGVVEEGGELVIVAPHITDVAIHHPDVERVGYHCMAWHIERGSIGAGYELSAIAHSSHVAGDGTYVGGVETLHARRTFATGISSDRCAAINVGYADPALFAGADLQALMDDPEVLVVPNAGEVLYLVQGTSLS